MTRKLTPIQVNAFILGFARILDMTSSGPEVTFTNHGSIVVIRMRTERALEWIKEVTETESWQWIGPRSLAIDTKYAGDIFNAALDEGLV